MTTAQPKSARKGLWLRTDEIEEFIGALEHSAELAETVRNDVMRWKWLILALHNALQGACTCALRGHDSAGISMLTKESAKAVWHWLDVESRKKSHPPMPAERLASLMALYKRVSDANYLSEPYRLPADDRRDRDVKKLNDLRNEFSHFVPKGFSLEVSGMPRVVRHTCDAIQHLAKAHVTFSRHLSRRQQGRISRALSSLRKSMDAWRARMRDKL